MQKLFKEFEDWLKLNYKDGLDDLNPPITKEELTKLKNELGFEIPNELVEMLKIHNGQKGEASYLFEEQEFLSSNRIIDEWKVWKNLLESGDLEDNKSDCFDKEIQNNWWNLKWLPFTYDGCGNHYCIDMNPSEWGEKGQIIEMYHDDSERKLLNNTLYSWFESYISKLKNKEYVYSKDYDEIICNDE